MKNAKLCYSRREVGLETDFPAQNPLPVTDLALRQFGAAFGAAACDDAATSRRGHTGTKTVLVLARAFFGLPGAFHRKSSPKVAFRRCGA
jgi:hypothetical protein